MLTHHHHRLAALAAASLLAACAAAPYTPVVEGTGRDGVPLEQHLRDCNEHGRAMTHAAGAMVAGAMQGALTGAVVGTVAGAAIGSGVSGYGASTGARDGLAAGAAGGAAGGALARAGSVPTGRTVYEAHVEECLGWRGYRVVR